MREAATLGLENVRSGHGGPFGALIVRNDAVVATGVNLVTANNDPTAHAEIVAIRAACEALHSFRLSGCEIYISCEPCPMCLGAIYWARLARYYFGCTRADAAAAGFDDMFIHGQIALPQYQRSIPGDLLPSTDAKMALAEWARSENKIAY